VFKVSTIGLHSCLQVAVFYEVLDDLVDRLLWRVDTFCDCIKMLVINKYYSKITSSYSRLIDASVTPIAFQLVGYPCCFNDSRVLLQYQLLTT